MREESKVRALLDDVLASVTAPHAQVVYTHRNRTATRFAENAITQNLGGEEERLALTVAFGMRHGSSLTNRLDHHGLAQLVRRAERIAQSSPEDPEYVPPIKPQPYPDVPVRHFRDVVALSPEDIAEGIKAVVGIADAKGYAASGIFEAGYANQAVANSEGVFVFDSETGVRFSTTIHGPRGSGSASINRHSYQRIDVVDLGEEALETAGEAQDPQPIEPGDYTVIFEPRATADLLAFLPWNMDAREADEGTTAFGSQVGQQLLSPLVTITTEIDDPGMPGSPFGEDGLPAQRRTWIEAGSVRRLFHDRYWADEKGEEPDPILFPLFMAGEEKSIDDLIADCVRGLLVKRLWYIRYVDRKELLLTGMTRDGLFLVEDGKIVGPVQNLRFNESLIVFLQNVAGLTRSEYVGGWGKLPGIMSHDFTFDSTTASL
jgi:predicted Zn-dependent protease